MSERDTNAAAGKRNTLKLAEAGHSQVVKMELYLGYQKRQHDKRSFCTVTVILPKKLAYNNK